jgi:formylglycine-generating enzyme required for sulfatase activity
MRSTAAFVLMILGFVASAFAAGTPAAKVVAAESRARVPWDGFVDVDVVVYMPVSGTSAAISLSATDGARAFSASTVEGDVSATTSGTYRVSWNVAADYPDLYAPAFTVTASASVAGFVPDAHSGDYMVVDLSGGTGAAAYPVAYLTEVPEGGWSEEHRTSKLVLRKIPKGSFTMGKRATDWPGAQDQNLHGASFTNAMWAGVFEVTQRQWELVKGGRPGFFRNDEFYMSRPVEMVNYNAVRGSALGAHWPSGASVDADSFIGLLRAKTGLANFDLPTEAQWEYACRAGAETALNNGCNLTNRTSDASLDLVARYGVSGSGTSNLSRGTARVGTFAPNAWGLHDMHGNVWEWCLDWYEPYPGLGVELVVDPRGPAEGTARVLRGGCWMSAAHECVGGSRSMAAAGVNSGASKYGFRVFGAVPEAPVWEGETEGSGVAAPVEYDGRILVTLAEATDAPAFVFTTGGYNGVEWAATNDVKRIGTHSACSRSPGTAPRGENVSTWMETCVKGVGTLSFWWKVSCEKDDSGRMEYDRLMLFTNGVEVARVDGETEWRRVTVEFGGKGPHVVRWEFLKDYYEPREADFADCGWVDGVTWAPRGLVFVVR